MKFIHNLDGMSDEDVKDYLGELSLHIGLKPEWDALDAIWMQQTDGMKHRVPYARRGTTEMLREIHSIEIVSVEPLEFAGTATFRITLRKVQTGRKEISIGSHSIEGLKGKELDAAIMTAQTRGCRRGTLQFIGAGLLDESEIAPVTDIRVAASLASLAGSPMVIPPQPIVPTNTQPGTDITKLTPEQLAAQAVLDKMTEPAPQPGPEAPVDPVKKPRKPRKSKNMVDILSPGQEAPKPPETLKPSVQIEMPVGQIDNKGQITPESVPTPEILQATSTPPSKELIPDLAWKNKLEKAASSAIPAESPTLGIPEEKLKQYRERLNIYATKVLPNAGMISTEGIGGVTMKLRKFAIGFAGVENAQRLTEQQWDDLHSFLDDYVQKNGPEALVAYINKSVGA